MSLKTWIQSPTEWGDWGVRFNAWMKQLTDFISYINVKDNGFATNTNVLPSVFFEGDPNTGFSHLSDQVDLYTGGVRRVSTGSAGMNVYVPINKITQGTAPLMTLGDWATNSAYSGLMSSSLTAGYMIMTEGAQTFINADTQINLRINNSTSDALKLTTNGVEISSMLQSVLNPYTGWSDYGAPYAGYRWYKDANGFVTLHGLVKNTSGATKPAGTYAILLPAGCHPPQDNLFTVQYNTGSNRLDILSNGAIVIQTSVINGGWFSVSGITFYAGW